MTAYSTQDILARHGHLKEVRALEEPAWRDIAQIIDLDGQEFQINERRQRDDLFVYDSTPLYALNDYVGGLFGESMNPAERWFELTIEDKDLAKWGPVRKWFWDQGSQLYASLSPSQSTFYSEASPWLANMGRYGNGFMYQEEWPERQAIIDRSIPIGESFINVDLAGNLDEFHRAFHLTGAQMMQKFGDAAGGAQEQHRYNVVHAVCLNPDFKPGALGPRGKRWLSTYVSEDLKNFRRDGAYYEMPYHALFWNRRSGKAWATGARATTPGRT
ncbi:portal protein [Bradyrhizobium sp. STM 3557]|uniref:portal protein n=1 Tax=Bradyrhizobium sp. STM 3557 TaxID=578920 RepID=UPI00388D5BBC